MLEKMIPHYPDHGGIISAKNRGRDMYPYSLLAAFFREPGTQTAVRGNPANYHHPVHFAFLRSPHCLRDKNIHNRLLVACNDVWELRRFNR